jgi:hypothetical protein
MTLTVDPAALVDSNPLYDRVTDLAACLCSAIQNPANGVPDVCFCGIVPGEAVTALYTGGNCKDKCGMAWVRVVSIYPMTQVGAPDLTPGNCGAGVGADVELGIFRCISIGDETGAPTTPAELLAAAQLQIADSLVMQQAVYCCAAIPPKEVIMSAYTPLGPAGGLVGGTWALSMGLG